MLINTETGKEEEVLKKIQELEAVKEAYMVYGKSDIIAKVVVAESVAESMEKLGEIICNIRKLKTINSTNILVVVS